MTSSTLASYLSDSPDPFGNREEGGRRERQREETESERAREREREREREV